MTNKIRHEKGVALMMVLAGVLVLSTIIVDLAYNSQVTYRQATAARDHLRAEALAMSAMNLVKLELKSERELRQKFASILSQVGGITSDPFCKVFPLSTGLIQGLSSGNLPGMGGEEKAEEEETEKSPAEGEDTFQLGGDFEGRCETEEQRINLNAFFVPTLPEGGEVPETPLQKRYEEQKTILASLLSGEEFEPIFKGDVDEIRRVVNRIADWADTDDRINEAPGISGGYEDSDYSDLPYKAKNGKYETVSELLLVPGVGDDIYTLLQPQVTVYGDGRINLCQASDQTVKAFLLSYSVGTPGATPLRPEDELLETILTGIREQCEQPSPTPEQLANIITTFLGGTTETPTEETEKTEKPKGRRGAKGGLASRISTTNRFFRIEALGVAGDTKVKLVSVVDTQSTGPNIWKTLYFKVD